MKHKDEIIKTIIRELVSIAPELNEKEIDQEADLRRTYDIDSFDYLNFLVAVNEELNVNIPERDYEKVTTVSRLAEYISKRMKQNEA